MLSISIFPVGGGRLTSITEVLVIARPVLWTSVQSSAHQLRTPTQSNATYPKQAARAEADLVSGTFHQILQPGLSRPEEDRYHASQSEGIVCIAEASEQRVRDIPTVTLVHFSSFLYPPTGGLTVTPVCFIRLHMILLAPTSSLELLGY